MSRISSEGFIVFTPTTHYTSADFIVYDKDTQAKYTVQVKSTYKESKRNKNAYVFDTRRPNRKNGDYENTSFDVIAFVVSSIREVRFEWYSNMPFKSQVIYHVEGGRYPWKANTLREILDGAQ